MVKERKSSRRSPKRRPLVVRKIPKWKKQPRDKSGRFAKPSKRMSPKAVIKRQPPRRKLTSSRITKRQFTQRYYIDKFKRDGHIEWEIFTIEVRGTKKGKPLTTKKRMIAKVKEIVR